MRSRTGPRAIGSWSPTGCPTSAGRSSWAATIARARRCSGPPAQAELAALGARAIQVDTQAAQGFLDFFEDAGKSIGKVFVETIPKAATTAAREVGGFVVEDVGGALADAGEAVVDIVKPIARDIERTTKLVWDETKGWVEQAVEDVGDVVEDTVAGAVKLAADTRDAFEELAHGVADALEEVVETVVRVTVEVAGKVYQFVADTVEVIGKFTQKVIETLGVAWHEFVDFIKDIFAWDDILHTHDVLVAKLNGGFDLMRDNVTALQGLTKGWLATLQEEMIDGIDQTIDQLGGGRIAAVSRDGGIDRSEASDKIDWLMSFVIDDPDEAPADPSTVRPNALLDKMQATIPDGVRTKLTALLARLTEQLKSFIENDMGVVIDAFLDGIALFQAALDDPKRSSGLVLSGVLSMVKGLAVTGIKVLGLVLDIVFEIVLLAIDLLKTAMNATLDIPVLSGLYKVLTGRELSPISVLAFIVAVPATIISKLAVGEAPFQGVGVAAQTLTEAELAEAKAKRDWAYVYGSMHLVMNVIDIVTDVQNATTKQEASTTRTETVAAQNDLPTAQWPHLDRAGRDPDHHHRRASSRATFPISTASIRRARRGPC